MRIQFIYFNRIHFHNQTASTALRIFENEKKSEDVICQRQDSAHSSKVSVIS
jgi:hypothetical protein